VKLPVRDASGQQLRQIQVDDSVFGITPNMAVLHQAFVTQRANQRWGTAQTKSRGEVRGSTRKVRAQKYTGRARAGSNRAPTRVGGGVAFGPRLRDYSKDFPKKMRRLAIRSALSGKVADGELVVIDQLDFERPKTREIVRLLDSVGVGSSVLIVTGRPDRTVLASARNLAKAKVVPAPYLNVLDMLTHRGLLITEEAVRVAESLWGRKAAPAPAAAERKPARRRTAAPAEEAPAAEAAAAAPAEAARPARRARKPVAEAPAVETEAAAELPKPARRTRRPAAEAAAEAPAEAARPARHPRKPAAEAPAVETEAAAEPPKPARRTRKPAVEAPLPETEAAAEPPKPARRTRKPVAEAPAAETGAAAEEPKPRRRTRKTAPAEGEEA